MTDIERQRRTIIPGSRYYYHRGADEEQAQYKQKRAPGIFWLVQNSAFPRLRSDTRISIIPSRCLPGGLMGTQESCPFPIALIA
jgi:hypothetical protein